MIFSFNGDRLIAKISALAILSGFLSSCGPATSSLNSSVPSGIDLTGIWVLDEGRSDSPPDQSAALQREKAAEIQGKSSNSLASMFFVVQDFPVVSANRLAIEQDADSIGISYGDGQHRDLIWGLQTRSEWRIDAGWEHTKLIVKSDVSHTSAVERYQLQSDGNTLVVDVSVRAGGDRETYRRTYVRE